MERIHRNTKDIYLAAVWMALGATYEGVDRTDPRHQEFSFSTERDSVDATGEGLLTVSRGVDLDLIEKQWVNAELVINAVRFKDAIQRMKAIIHSY